MWILKRIDYNQIIRDDCTCADHCKEVARRERKQGKHGYNQKMQFMIIDPRGEGWAISQKNSGWRVKWDRI